MFNKLFSAGNRVAFFKGLPMNNNLKTFNIGDLEKYEKYKLKYENETKATFIRITFNVVLAFWISQR